MRKYYLEGHKDKEFIKSCTRKLLELADEVRKGMA